MQLIATIAILVMSILLGKASQEEPRHPTGDAIVAGLALVLLMGGLFNLALIAVGFYG